MSLQPAAPRPSTPATIEPAGAPPARLIDAPPPPSGATGAPVALFRTRSRVLGAARPPLRDEASLRGGGLLRNLMRLTVLLLVAGVLLGSYVVAGAHLTEQFLGVPEQTVGLIDSNAGQGALTPENIEKQVLVFNLRLREEELDQPAGANVRPRPFVINPGEPARYIAARLAEAGFIADADLFNLYLRVSQLDRGIDAGNFMLSEAMTMRQVATALQDASFEEALVTIPEGFRAEEVAERLAAAEIVDPETFLNAVRAPRSLALFDDYDFLQNLPGDASLEGFLFPDTYRLPVFASSP
ncbi:MAG: endolytic transglycosylase MltG, partial [Caldilineaceae bacterium]